MNARKELLVKGIKMPPEDVKEYLKTDRRHLLYPLQAGREQRTRIPGESFIPLDSVPDIDEVEVCQTPFYEMMQQKAVKKIFKVVQMIEISEMNGDAASILKTAKGTPVLLLHRLLVGIGRQAHRLYPADGRRQKVQDYRRN